MKYYNPSIVKIFRELFAPKAGDQAIAQALPYITPVKDLKPKTEFLITLQDTGTLIDATATRFRNRNVYVRGFHINSANTTSTGVTTELIAFLTEDGANPFFRLSTGESDSNSVTVDFGERGLLLAKTSSTVNTVKDASSTATNFAIWGYTEEVITGNI